MLRRNDFFAAGRRPPQFYQDILSKYGQNLYGENLLRLVWLPSRCYWVGGWWEVEQDFAYRLMPKYGVKNERWAIEKWMPAETYGNPEVWESQTLSLEGFLQVGPFPSHGEFESAAVFSVGKGPSGYVPLEPGTVDLQARLIHLGRKRSIWDIRHALRTEQEAQKLSQDASFEEMWESLQHTREGLTIGPAGNYSNDAAKEAYKQKLLRNKQSWVAQSDYQGGFMQDQNIGG